MEYPLAQSLSDGITDARIWRALDRNVADLAFFIDDRRDDHLAMRVFLAQVGGNLRPFTDCRRWSQNLPRNLSIGLGRSILKGPGWVGLLFTALHRNVNGENTLIGEDAEIFQAAA